MEWVLLLVSLSPPGGCLFCVESFFQKWCTAVQKKANHLDAFRTLCLFVVSDETKKKLTAEFVAITKDTMERCSSMLEMSDYNLPDATKLWEFMFNQRGKLGLFSLKISVAKVPMIYCSPFPIAFVLDTQVPLSSMMTMKQAL